MTRKSSEHHQEKKNVAPAKKEEVCPRVVQTFRLEKKTETWGGKCCEKNRVPSFCRLCFFQSWKNTESTKSGDSVFFHSISPHVWDSVFFRADIFRLLSLSLPLICWSQGFGYGFLASYVIIICTRPDFLRTLLQNRTT